jgi:hypothetical protein
MRLVCRPTEMRRANPFAAVRFATTGMVMAMAMLPLREVRTG